MPQTRNRQIGTLRSSSRRSSSSRRGSTSSSSRSSSSSSSSSSSRRSSSSGRTYFPRPSQVSGTPHGRGKLKTMGLTPSQPTGTPIFQKHYHIEIQSLGNGKGLLGTIRGSLGASFRTIRRHSAVLGCPGSLARHFESQPIVHQAATGTTRGFQRSRRASWQGARPLEACRSGRSREATFRSLIRELLILPGVLNRLPLAGRIPKRGFFIRFPTCKMVCPNPSCFNTQFNSWPLLQGIYIYIHIPLNIIIHVHMHIPLPVSTHISIHISIHIHIHIHIHMHIHIHIHMHIHTHMHIHIHMHMHIHKVCI